MPAKNQLRPGSMTTRIRQWFADNPGPHKPSECADALGAVGKRERVAVMSQVARLARTGGALHRWRAEESAAMGPGVYYSAHPGTAANVPTAPESQ